MSTPSPAFVPQWTRGDRMRKAREHAGLQQQEMAEELGLSRNTVGNYEADRTVPGKLAMAAWAMRCGVPLRWLSDGSMPTGTEPAGITRLALVA